ncbi:S8 family peptidase [Cytophagaceae bacterium 50C-KIRBA]|uniref:S8 family peptidase n=1 Tax=Aquirufa beregesia TaxID=2516556 RepID=A0ABX0EY65_9BACT|nr:S8 family peptidase [Aquirufa beregesia]NGZ44373.1 S8 family peptidase [Aquirufa beregesia]
MALYNHIFISGIVNSENYRAPSRIGAKPRIPLRDRAIQGQKLLSQFDAIWQTKELLQQQRSAEQISTREGTYITFTSAADQDLITKSLEDLRKGIRLLNIKEILVGENQTQIRATVYVPNGKEGHFISKIQKYQQEETQKGDPKNAPLVNSIEDVSIALLEGLWTDNPQHIPTDNAKWCEAWLNVNTKENQEQEQIAQFLTTLESIGIEVKHNSIIFPERAVLLVNANREQLIELMLRSDLLAEFRAGQEPAGFWVNESRVGQQAWVDDLLNRIQLVESNVKICLLDSGVNNGHQLLQSIIDDTNTLTVDNAWGTDDHEPRAGHGTLMAGIAGYGQIEQVLVSANVVLLTHKLCSVKILPRPNQVQTPKELWGDITSQGIARAEIQNPNMVLVYCMSVTSHEDTDKGRPSSWSGAMDNLAFGEGENQRLIIVSAGNIRDFESWRNYPNSNFTSSVQNPAQSWNTLVAGAYTEKIQVNDSNFQSHTPLANEGELSPYSSTSLMWERKWPVKPDVVFEGGNLLRAPDNSVTAHEDLELLSTSSSFQTNPFDTINATSAAAAQASWFAAKITYKYPNAWAETIRGLIVHSANWNQAMLAQMQVQQGNRTSFRNLLKTFGFGIPDLDRALYSQESALTFIAQETIQPFNFKEVSSTAETNEIHFFNLPWPRNLLLGMGEVRVKLRITLSYFIEPGAGEIGWKDKYRYQSHGLRFDVNNVGESEDDFRKRVNIAARDENEEVNGNAGSNRWAIGTNNRSNGSIHSDFWEGTAADLATCNQIAIYPVIGWWRERKHLGKVENQTRYSLIVSLDTPAQDVELYTTVKNMIEVPIEIPTT